MTSITRPKIPQAIKRKVLVEAGHRCAIQTCRYDSNIDIHHIVPWATCKEHREENLIALCPNCHRLVHNNKIDRKSLLLYKETCQRLTTPLEPEIVIEHDLQAFIKLKPYGIPAILDSNNVMSYTDERNSIAQGGLIFTVHFIEPLVDPNFVMKPIADGNVLFKVLSKTTHNAKIEILFPSPDIVRFDFI